MSNAASGPFRPMPGLFSKRTANNVAVDAFGNLYFSTSSNTITEWVASTNNLTTLVSNGISLHRTVSQLTWQETFILPTPVITQLKNGRQRTVT